MRQAVAPREDRQVLGIFGMSLAVLCFTLIDTSAKWLILSGLPALQVVFARYAGHFLISLAVFLPHHGSAAFHSNQPVRQFLRSMALLGGTFFNFLALSYLPITVTTTIMFAGPVLITFLAIPLLKETVGIHRMIAVCAGFLGVLVVIQPGGVAFHPAIFLSLCALICASLFFILTRSLAGIDSNATSQIWSSGVAVICLLPPAIHVWIWPSTTTQIIVLIVIGLFGAAGHTASTWAHRLADASILAPMIYLQLFFATAAGLLVFDTAPAPSTTLGGVIIIAAGIYIWHRERKIR